MSRKRILLVIGLLVILGFGIYKIWENTQFRVIATTPSISRSVTTGTSVIKIDFSHDLSSEGVYDRTIIAEGQSHIREVEQRDRSLYIRLFELSEGNEYKIKLKDIFSSDGEVLRGYEINFIATYIPYERLSQAQKDLESQETDRFEPDDPILDHIPFSTIGYSIEPVHDTTEEGVYSLIINAKIFLSNADRGFEDQATEAYKQEIFNYLQSKDINPEDYQFNYIVHDPAY